MRTRAYVIIASKGTIFSVKEMSETSTFFAKLNFFNYIVPNAMFSALKRLLCLYVRTLVCLETHSVLQLDVLFRCFCCIMLSFFLCTLIICKNSLWKEVRVLIAISTCTYPRKSVYLSP